ncbi:MAG: Wzz/FepE/Etk N-terminal domain-containing protein [Clostridiaceae bacterium]|nr:Wzz/FepE/Etk N-terminal domain-containing protein [Clostridiaceae bacterium]
MEEIDLKKLFLILRKRLWVIILVTTLCTAASGLISYFILQPEYLTFTTLMIGRPQEYKEKMEYNDVLLNQKLVSTYGEIAKSRVVAKEWMSNLGLSLTYEELDKKIDVTLVKDTEIIKITVKDKQGEAAAQIANEIAKVFMKHVARIMNIENIQVIDRAEVPLKPEKPKPAIYMLIASVLSIMLSIFFIFVYEYFDNTVKTQEEIENYFMLPVLGVIPKVQ